MYSNPGQTICSVKDGLEKESRLVLLYLLWSAICTYWGVWNACGMYEFYGMEVSVADLLIAQQDGGKVGLMIFPAVAFLVMKCKKNGLNIQLVLRYGSRRKMLLRQIMESLWYAVVSGAVLLGMEFLIAWAAKGTLINWDSTGSIYYAYTGELSMTNIITVAAGIFCMYVIKLMIVFVLTDILLWYPKTLVLLWILLVLAVGMEKVADVPVFHFFFSIQYSTWLKPVIFPDRVLTGMCVLFAIYMVGIACINKKDIFYC